MIGAIACLVVLYTCRAAGVHNNGRIFGFWQICIRLAGHFSQFNHLAVGKDADLSETCCVRRFQLVFKDNLQNQSQSNMILRIDILKVFSLYLPKRSLWE